MEYPDALSTLARELADARNAYPHSTVTRLAGRLMDGAKRMDLAGLARQLQSAPPVGPARDFDHPPAYTHPSVLGAAWADNAACPLEAGETWNAGRRATASGVRYQLDSDGLPVNPYVNTGITGRGRLGQFGPNHAVDNGVLMVKPDENGVLALYALGILRKHDGDAAALSGGFLKFEADDNGAYHVDHDGVVLSRVEEFFEEMISGSVPLHPVMEAQAEALLMVETGRREKASGQKMSDALRNELKEQIETSLRLDQLRRLDSGFYRRLYKFVASGRECYAGPVLQDPRNTNSAWIETHLSWFVMDDATWADIRGSKPYYNYQLSAGDDASGVVLHRLDGALLSRAYASHGAFFAYLAAAFLLDVQARGGMVAPSIVTQLTDMADAQDRAAPLPAADARFAAARGPKFA